MNMETLGYYLYMSKQEEQQNKMQQEVNVENYFHLVGVEATTNEEQDLNFDFSFKYTPL